VPLMSLSRRTIAYDFTDQRLSKFFTHTNDPAGMAQRFNQRLVTDYHMSDEEQARIKPLTAAMAQRIFELRRKFGADIIATFDDYHQQVAAQMTPEQREAYQKLNAERRQRMTEMLLPDAKPTTGTGN